MARLLNAQDRQLLSRPVKLQWAGWQTDTYTLQSAGWSLSADQDVYSGRMRIMMRHEAMQMQAMTDEVAFDYARNAMDFSYLENFVVPCQALGRRVEIHMHGVIDWTSFKPIDAHPQFVERTVASLEDLVHFAPALVRTQEIIVPEETVPDLMERILKMQDPARQARLKAELREARYGQDIRYAPQQKFHAQILSIVRAA